MVFNLVYFGSPSFSADILESLITNPPENIKVVAVVTNPDRPTGRHQRLSPSPVAQLAQQHHLPIFKPDKLNSSNLAHIKLLNPHLFLIAAYGKIIPPDWLDLPQIAPLNLHFSLLPQYRGAWTNINHQPLKILSTTLKQDRLEIDRIQLPGKNPITWTQFLSGHPLKI